MPENFSESDRDLITNFKKEPFNHFTQIINLCRKQAEENNHEGLEKLLEILTSNYDPLNTFRLPLIISCLEEILSTNYSHFLIKDYIEIAKKELKLIPNKERRDNLLERFYLFKKIDSPQEISIEDTSTFNNSDEKRLLKECKIVLSQCLKTTTDNPDYQELPSLREFSHNLTQLFLLYKNKSAAEQIELIEELNNQKFGSLTSIFHINYIVVFIDKLVNFYINENLLLHSNTEKLTPIILENLVQLLPLVSTQTIADMLVIMEEELKKTPNTHILSENLTQYDFNNILNHLVKKYEKKDISELKKYAIPKIFHKLYVTDDMRQKGFDYIVKLLDKQNSHLFAPIILTILHELSIDNAVNAEKFLHLLDKTSRWRYLQLRILLENDSLNYDKNAVKLELLNNLKNPIEVSHELRKEDAVRLLKNFTLTPEERNIILNALQSIYTDISHIYSKKESLFFEVENISEDDRQRLLLILNQKIARGNASFILNHIIQYSKTESEFSHCAQLILEHKEYSLFDLLLMKLTKDLLPTYIPLLMEKIIKEPALVDVIIKLAFSNDQIKSLTLKSLLSYVKECSETPPNAEVIKAIFKLLIHLNVTKEEMSRLISDEEISPVSKLIIEYHMIYFFDRPNYNRVLSPHNNVLFSDYMLDDLIERKKSGFTPADHSVMLNWLYKGNVNVQVLAAIEFLKLKDLPPGIECNKVEIYRFLIEQLDNIDIDQDQFIYLSSYLLILIDNPNRDPELEQLVQNTQLSQRAQILKRLQTIPTAQWTDEIVSLFAITNLSLNKSTFEKISELYLSSPDIKLQETAGFVLQILLHKNLHTLDKAVKQKALEIYLENDESYEAALLLSESDLSDVFTDEKNQNLINQLENLAIRDLLHIFKGTSLGLLIDLCSKTTKLTLKEKLTQFIAEKIIDEAWFVKLPEKKIVIEGKEFFLPNDIIKIILKHNANEKTDEILVSLENAANSLAFSPEILPTSALEIEKESLNAELNSDIRTTPSVNNFYSYSTDQDNSKKTNKGRYHFFAASSSDSNLKGDALKTSILKEYIHELSEYDSEELLLQRYAEIKKESNYKILELGQGLATRLLKRDTDSVKALDKYVEQRKGEIVSIEQQIKFK